MCLLLRASSLSCSPRQQPSRTTQFLRSLPVPEIAIGSHGTTFIFRCGRSPGFEIVSPLFIPFSAPAPAPWRLLIESRFLVLPFRLPFPPPLSPSLGPQARCAVALWVSFCFLACSQSLEIVAARSLKDYSFPFVKEILSLGRHCPNTVLFFIILHGMNDWTIVLRCGRK